MICAFIANAASFVLPISNPANLVIYGSHMPPLLQWLPRYLLPSRVSIAATYVLLRLDAAPRTASDHRRPRAGAALSGRRQNRGGRHRRPRRSCCSVASAMDMRLGLPTCVAGVATAAIVLLIQPAKAWSTVKDISWGVLPLVAGLFVLVEALKETGVVAMIGALLREAAAHSAAGGVGAGVAVAVGSNLANNLPVGLIGGSVLQSDHMADQVTRAILIGVDLGPNLSVTGSLATILWLTALRRER